MCILDLIEDAPLGALEGWGDGWRNHAFEQSCLNFEKLHGERAANDFRQPTEKPADLTGTAPPSSPGGKKYGAVIIPCVAPSEASARIGAFPL